MPQRRNEELSLPRPEPFARKLTYNASSQLLYEAWADPGSSEADAVWMACKYTYDANGFLTKIEWADGARFNQVVSDLSTFSYS